MRSGLNADENEVALRNGAEGDEKIRGPVFNYARLFTWWRLSQTMADAFDQLLDRMSRNETCSGASWNTRVVEQNFIGDSERTAAYCGLGRDKRHATYADWAEIPLLIKMRMFYAALLALALQWSTTGASIMIAYMTPAVGLGCRSASYLAYGLLSTLSFLCLLFSSLLTQEVMRRHQQRREKRSLADSGICFAGITLRMAGKGLASINALWLITSSLLEIAGGYDSCWCNGVFLTKHNKGYVVLFKSAAQLENLSKFYWRGGLALTLASCVVACGCFFLGSKKIKRS